MKNPILLLFIFGILIFYSCQKESDCDTGRVRFTCVSSNPYDLYVDGSFLTVVGGNSFVEYDLQEGNHQVKAEQVSGYILYPTVKQANISVFGCQESEWIFP